MCRSGVGRSVVSLTHTLTNQVMIIIHDAKTGTCCPTGSPFFIDTPLLIGTTTFKSCQATRNLAVVVVVVTVVVVAATTTVVVVIIHQ